MNSVIETLENQIVNFEKWVTELDNSIKQWNEKLNREEAQKSEILLKIEALKEAIWKLQNDPR